MHSRLLTPTTYISRVVRSTLVGDGGDQHSSRCQFSATSARVVAWTVHRTLRRPPHPKPHQKNPSESDCPASWRRSLFTSNIQIIPAPTSYRVQWSNEREPPINHNRLVEGRIASTNGHSGKISHLGVQTWRHTAQTAHPPKPQNIDHVRCIVVPLSSSA